MTRTVYLNGLQRALAVQLCWLQGQHASHNCVFVVKENKSAERTGFENGSVPQYSIRLSSTQKREKKHQQSNKLEVKSGFKIITFTVYSTFLVQLPPIH
ncbi:CLUMA_CG019165, isoform A [Clunio marinus]|uniref:CLUMA_CG019165, isoform A n=1 Tax=Clunio marinus TaxID=568069 RepID=A0A1J1J2F5_9DIPT|nr:CLUMA_CG019165, isoform A [Clunio marinus]